jgi:hypothetical protein
MSKRMRSIPWLAMVLLLAVAGRANAHEVKVTLQPENNSGESGIVILTETDDDKKTQVDVTVTGQPTGVAQPMHIHKGTCATLRSMPMAMAEYGLPVLQGGKVTGVIDVPLDTLQGEPHAINGHKSAQSTQSAFCGDIPSE